MTKYYNKVILITMIIVLSTPTLGASNQFENQDVLTESKVKKKSFKKIFKYIKKTLPKESRKCQIEIVDIKLLKDDKSGIGENWTVKICEDVREYLVTTFYPKGYYCNVMTKEDALAKEKRLWDSDKKFGGNVWTNSLYYIDELEAMDQSEKE